MAEQQESEKILLAWLQRQQKEIENLQGSIRALSSRLGQFQFDNLAAHQKIEISEERLRAAIQDLLKSRDAQGKRLSKTESDSIPALRDEIHAVAANLDRLLGNYAAQIKDLARRVKALESSKSQSSAAWDDVKKEAIKVLIEITVIGFVSWFVIGFQSQLFNSNPLIQEENQGMQ